MPNLQREQLGILLFSPRYDLYNITDKLLLTDELKLKDVFDDFLKAKNVSNTSQLKAHCRRELFHAVWRILLSDPDFMDAYKHGIVLECTDGVKRCFYPRIFIYSADYPEKYNVFVMTDGIIQ